MVDEEVQEEQVNAEMKAAETENGVSPDDDMDSLMNELDQQKTSPEGTGGSGDGWGFPGRGSDNGGGGGGAVLAALAGAALLYTSVK